MRTIILGAGIAGLTAAMGESRRGAEVVVVDVYERVGGNHISYEIGPYSFDIGSFIFSPDMPLFTEFPEVRRRCIPVPISFQRVAPDGRVRRYPFEEKELLSLRPHQLAAAALSFVGQRFRRGRPCNVAEVASSQIGPWLYRHLGLENYLMRFYDLPPEQIDPLFADKRMQQLLREARFGRLARRMLRLILRRSKSGPAATTLVRPSAGFDAFYAPVRAALEGLGVEFRLGEAMLRITSGPDGVKLDTERATYRGDRLISTIPVKTTLSLIGKQAEGIKSSRLTSLFVSFHGRRGFSAPVLYNFQSAGMWKRLTMHSDAYGLSNGRSYCSVEVTSSGEEPPVDPRTVFDDFRDHTRATGLFEGDLRLEGSTVTENAYPVYRIGVAAEIARARALAAETGIILAGRQGLHDYLPTSWHVMTQVNAELRQAEQRPNASH